MANQYVQSLMGESERILLVNRQHLLVALRPLLLDILAVAVLFGLITLLLVPVFPPGVVAYAVLLIPLAGIVRELLIWWNRQYIVTNRRVIQISGVFNKNVIDSSLEKVNDVKMEQSFLGRLLDYGDVEILTASELGANLFRRIQNPVRFKTVMLNAKEEMGREEWDTEGTPVQRPEDIPAAIARLDALRQKGVVTEEEFRKKKQELLARM
jgi:uncharacterized membrane protein YdbT with pleckstrin-like domain